MATKKETKEQNDLLNQQNELLKKGGDLEERRISLAAKLTEKIKESTEKLADGISNLGITEKIQDALNISNRYVQTIVKDIIPNAFKAMGNSAKKTFNSVTGLAGGFFNKIKSLGGAFKDNAGKGMKFFDRFGDSIEVNEKKVDDMKSALNDLQAKNETAFGLESNPHYMSPDKVEEMNAALAKQEKLTNDLLAAETHLSKLKNKPKFFSKENFREKRADVLEKLGGATKRGLSAVGNATKAITKKAAIGVSLFAGGIIVGLIASIGKAISFAFTRLQEVEDSVIDIRRAFGFTNKGVKQFSDYIDSTRGYFLSLGLSSADVATNIIGMVSVLGEARKITNDEISLINELNARLGISAEVAAGVLDVFQLYGPETKKQAAHSVASLATLAAAAGISFNKVSEDISGNAEEILTVFSGYDKALGNAAIQARLLGLDIGRIANVAEGLLDFETSITKEMEAEVLLGRNINLESLRRAAFLGDEEGVVRGIADLTRQIGNMEKLNFFQKKALAEATGLTVKELQTAFLLQTKLGKLTASERKQYDALTDAEKERVNSSKESLSAGLRHNKNMEPLLSSMGKLKAKWEQIKELIARPLSRVIDIIINKFSAMLTKLEGQIKSGGLLTAFEKFGAVVGDILDKIFDQDFIDKVTKFIQKSIDLVVKIVTAAGQLFAGIGGGRGGSGHGNVADVIDPKAKTNTTTGAPEAPIRSSVNDAIIHAGRIITTHPEDYLIATKTPKDLAKQPIIVKQDFPPELVAMIRNTNNLIDSLMKNGIDARVAPKKLSKAVYAENNVR